MKHRIFGGSTTNGYTKRVTMCQSMSKLCRPSVHLKKNKTAGKWMVMPPYYSQYISISSNTHHSHKQKKQVFTCDIFSASTPLGSRAHSIFCHCPRGSTRRRGAGPGPFSGSVAVPLHPKNIIYVLYIYLFIYVWAVKKNKENHKSVTNI